MGNLVWHEYARYVSLIASTYTFWAAYWGFFYRKFFWDFVGGVMRNPGGFQASNSNAIFVTLIVKAPVIQIVSLFISGFMVAIDYPLPLLKNTSLQRSLVLKPVMLLFQAFLALLFYQGTNGALWSMIAAACYIRALMLGETMAEAKENRGKGGRA